MKAQEQLYDIQTEVKQKVNTETYIDFVNFNFHFSLIFCFNLNFDSIQSLDLKVLELDLKKKCHLILNTQAMAKENLVNKARNLGVRASQHTAKVINQVHTLLLSYFIYQGNHVNHGNQSGTHSHTFILHISYFKVIMVIMVINQVRTFICNQGTQGRQCNQSGTHSHTFTLHISYFIFHTSYFIFQGNQSGTHFHM